MKNKILLIIIVTMVSLLVLNGCKKGEDDPFFSFRSRDARLAGEWVIKSLNTSEAMSQETNVTNNVNSDMTNINSTSKKTVSVSNNNMIMNTTYSETKSETETNYEMGDTSVFVTTTDTTVTEINSTREYDYKVDLEIKKEGTWHASFSRSLVSIDTMFVMIKNATDTTLYFKLDTVFAPQSTYNWTEEGEWTWYDSDKPKIIIDAGPMFGNIIRLANDEIIIEDSYTETENFTDNEGDEFFSYDDLLNPLHREDGIQTTIYMSSTTRSSDQEWQPK